ncbi:MAG: amidohydrolase family protein, partial [Chitinophagaceae bacterium]
EGKELAEMYELRESGAQAFSDGLKPIQSAGMMVKALQYVKRFNGVIIQVPDDQTMAAHGLMNEGIVSTRMGLPGKPVIAEELMVSRDIALAGYTGSRLHITGISSPRAVDAVYKAKQEGINVSCSVTPYHLFFCDEDLVTYDSYLKVNPPLRTRTDMLALRQALRDGKIDCIASHHLPQEYDSKILEFEYAKNGMITLECLYGAILEAVPDLSPEHTVELLQANPAKIFGLDTNSIREGASADLTLFQPGNKYRFEMSMIKSISKNSPFIGKELTGKVVGIITKKSMRLN